MKSEKVYECKITNYKLHYSLNNDHAVLTNVEFDYKNFYAFSFLLRQSIDSLYSLNIDYVLQYVTKYDWENYLKNKTTFTIYSDLNNDIYLLKSNITEFIKNYSTGLGLENVQE